MTPPTEIEAMEEALKWASETIKNRREFKLRPGSFEVTVQAAKSYLQLLKGEHETLVVVPREPTKKQLDAYYETLYFGQNVCEDAGGYMMRRIKAFITGKSQIDDDHMTYNAIIQAAQEGE